MWGDLVPNVTLDTEYTLTRRQVGGLVLGTATGTFAFDHEALPLIEDQGGVVVSEIQHSPTPVSPGDGVEATIQFANLSDQSYDIQSAYVLTDPKGNRYHDPATRKVFAVPGRTTGRVTYSWTASQNIIEGQFEHEASLATRTGKGSFQDVTDSVEFTVQRAGEGIIGEIIDALSWIPSTLSDIFFGFADYVLGLAHRPGALLHGVRDGLVSAVESYGATAQSLYEQPIQTLGQIAGGILAVLSNLDRPLYLFDAAVQGIADRAQSEMPNYASEDARDAYGTGWPIGWGVIQILVGLLGYLAADLCGDQYDAEDE